MVAPVAEILHEIGDVLAISMLIPLLLFILFYGVKSPWRTTELGIAVLVQKIAISLLVLDLVLANYLPTSWRLPFLVARVAIFGLVGFLLTADFINLRLIQTGSRHHLIFRWLRKKNRLDPR